MKKILLPLLFIMNQAFADELTFYVMPAHQPLDWTTPESVMKSYLKNKITFQNYPLGHVWTGLKCGDKEELTGTKATSLDVINQTLMGRGLGIFYHTFEGQMESLEDVSKELENQESEGSASFLRFQLSDSQCKRAQQYLKEFKDKNVSKNFGLVHKPRSGEGSNGLSFALSFLDVLNIFDEELRINVLRSVNIPEELIGPPLRDETVSIWDLYSRRLSWAKDNQKSRILPFWDIDKLYTWINQKINRPRDLKVLTKGKMKGIVFDKSHLPTPPEPLWEQVIDGKTKQVIPRTF